MDVIVDGLVRLDTTACYSMKPKCLIDKRQDDICDWLLHFAQPHSPICTSLGSDALTGAATELDT